MAINEAQLTDVLPASLQLRQKPPATKPAVVSAPRPTGVNTVEFLVRAEYNTSRGSFLHVGH